MSRGLGDVYKRQGFFDTTLPLPTKKKLAIFEVFSKEVTIEGDDDHGRGRGHHHDKDDD